MVNIERQTSHIKHQMTIAKSNFSDQSEPLLLTKAGPKTSNWIKSAGKQIERPNQEEDWSNQRLNNQQIFQGLHQSKIRDP